MLGMLFIIDSPSAPFQRRAPGITVMPAGKSLDYRVRLMRLHNTAKSSQNQRLAATVVI
jgi:hypothetical protein